MSDKETSVGSDRIDDETGAIDHGDTQYVSPEIQAARSGQTVAMVSDEADPERGA